MNSFCQLARRALHFWHAHGSVLVPAETYQRRAACFVSLHAADGSLRGCMGTLQPTHSDLACEIAENAVAAASRDPRFTPVSAEELADLSLDISVLAEPEAIGDAALLDPQRYGVIVQAGRKRGVLLPGLEGIETVADQLRIAKRKAGIPAEQKASLQRFEVTWHHE